MGDWNLTLSSKGSTVNFRGQHTKKGRIMALLLHSNKMMRLKVVAVANFHCIVNSRPIYIDDRITVLVGRNESGKSSILRAIEYFSTDGPLDIEEIHQDARSNAPYTIPITTMTFDCSELVTKPDASDFTLSITKFADGRYYVNHCGFKEFDETLYPLDPEEAFINLIKPGITSLKMDLDKQKLRLPDFSNESEIGYKEILDEFLTFIIEEEFENNMVELIYSKLNILEETLIELEPIDDKIEAMINGFFEDLRQKVNNFDASNVISDDWKWFFDNVPKLIFHSGLDVLEDQVKLNELAENPELHKITTDLLTLCDRTLADFLVNNQRTRKKHSQHVSTTLSSNLNAFWDQDKVTVEVWDSDGDLLVQISDETIQNNKPSQRSEGFKWYLGFFIRFMAVTKEKFVNTVFLLDDPALFLHPSGQKDVLKMLEVLSQNNQFIYTTHLPGLIDLGRGLPRIRILEKRDDGTIVKNRISGKTRGDSLAPLRASIGLTAADSLFHFKNTLVVEGEADMVIINTILSELVNQGEEWASEIAIIPAAGAPKAPVVASMLAASGNKFHVLLDADKKGMIVKKKFVKLDLLKYLTMVNELKDDAIEIEEIFRDVYFSAVTKAYRDILGPKKQIDEADLEVDVPMLTKQYSKYFTTRRLGSFDKVRVAGEIAEMIVSNKDNDCISEASKLIEVFLKSTFTK